MAKQAVTNGDQISTTAHLWRINTSATYTTWPSLDQFNGTNGQTMDKRATMTSETYTLPDGVSRATYTNAVWVDVDLACGQCHKGAVANAPVLSKAQLAISAKTMHGDTAAVSAMTADECLTCHTAIVPGINHHAVRTTCTECHGTAVMPLHKGAVPDKTSNAFCLNCHKNSGPQAVHHAVSTVTATCVSCHTIPGVTVPMANRTDKTVVTTACQLCHASEQTRTTSGTTRAIVVSGAGDNHHNGSGTNASRSVAACIYCHGLGKPFGDASTEVMVDQVAPNTSSCNGACHSSALPSSGTHHTGAGLTPTNGFLCLTCHAPTGPAPAGVTTPTFPPANVADCTACHGTTPMTGTRSVALGAGTNHRQNTTFTPSRCDVCHVNAGIKPTIATCAAQCHADPAKAPVLDSAVLGSYLAGMHDPKVVFVNHAPVALGLRTAYTGTSFASPTIVTNNTNAAAFTDASTDEDANVKTVTVSWGDGVVSSVTTTGTPFTHNYTRAGTYQIIHTVKDNGGLGNTERAFVKIAPPIYTVTGTVSASGSPLSGAIVYLKLNGHTRAIARTAANGIYTFPRVLPGSYTITTVKKGYAFSTVVTVDVTGAATADIAAD
jgi:hypothetical protein